LNINKLHYQHIAFNNITICESLKFQSEKFLKDILKIRKKIVLKWYLCSYYEG